MTNGPTAPKPWLSFNDVREGIDHHDASLFAQELALQCGYAMRAYRLLREAIVAGDRIFEAWYHAQAFLNSTAAASLILWPSSGRPPSQSDLDKLRRARGRVLRDAIGVAGLAPLKQRAMRDHLVHFDERLTRFIAEHHDAYSDLNIYPDHGMPPPPGRLRHIDYDTMILSFRGDTIDLAALHATIMELSRRINEGNWQHLVPAEQLSGADVSA